MNINDLTDQEKSVLLAKVMGWETIPNPLDPTAPHFIKVAESEHIKEGWVDDLYHPVDMALAWRVLNWWHRLWWPNAVGKASPMWYEFDKWWGGIVGWGFEPQELQRSALDKILELAIEAGLVAEEERG